MSNFKLKLDLRKLNMVGIAKVQGKTGLKECVVIPVEENGIIRGEKGGIWINARMIANKNDQGTEIPDRYDNTHFIALAINGKNLEGLSDDEKRAKQPIFGNAELLEKKDANVPEAKMVEIENMDDIPF